MKDEGNWTDVSSGGPPEDLRKSEKEKFSKLLDEIRKKMEDEFEDKLILGWTGWDCYEDEYPDKVYKKWKTCFGNIRVLVEESNMKMTTDFDQFRDEIIDFMNLSAFLYALSKKAE